MGRGRSDIGTEVVILFARERKSMSAIAYALSLFPDDDKWLIVSQLVHVIEEYRGMSSDEHASYHDVIRDHYDQLAEQLAGAVRALPDSAREPGALNVAMATAALPPVDCSDPGAAYRTTVIAGLGATASHVEEDVRRIICRAAVTPSTEQSPRAGEWSARRTGRPTTPLQLEHRVAELRREGHIWKVIASIVNGEFETDMSEHAVRELLKPRRQTP